MILRRITEAGPNTGVFVKHWDSNILSPSLILQNTKIKTKLSTKYKKKSFFLD
jgi:hypothetical protein